jgi:predicted acylesterase/phospholipase RssA
MTACLCASLLTALAPAAHSEPDEPTVPSLDPTRPRVGLVLSGGGARGLAHIGVLKVLDELRIPVDVIAATSMGSIVGGAYAAGYTPAQLERLVNATDWREIFARRAPRADLHFRRKEDDFLNLSDIEFGIRPDGVTLPRGAVGTHNLGLFLRALGGPVKEVNDLAQLPIPFAAMATDLATGKLVVLQKGVSLSSAMRASMSVPGAFAPFEYRGQVLVDGGLVRNLPADIARAMGAEIVIAVNEPGAGRQGARHQRRADPRPAHGRRRRRARTELDVPPGKPLRAAEIDRAIQRVFGRGDFESVSYSLIDEPLGRRLVVTPYEKSWGYNALRFGGNVVTGFGASDSLNLLAAHTWSWLNAAGGEWRNEVQIGDQRRALTEFFQPLYAGSRWFVLPRLWSQREEIDIFVDRNALFTLETRLSAIELQLGREMPGFGTARVTGGRVRAQNRVRVGAPLPRSSSVETSVVGAEFRIDRHAHRRDRRRAQHVRAHVHRAQHLGCVRRNRDADLPRRVARGRLRARRRFRRAERLAARILVVPRRGFVDRAASHGGRADDRRGRGVVFDVGEGSVTRVAEAKETSC